MMRTLYGYWRSTAAYRVRIALGLKSLPYESISINLRAGEQLGEAFKKINPQSLVPWLVDGEAGLGQSLAIIEYLDEVYPDPPLIPGDSIERAKIRSMAQIVDQHADIGVGTVQNERRLPSPGRQGGIETSDQPLGRRFLISGGAVDLAGEIPAGLAPRLQRRLQLAGIDDIVYYGIARPQPQCKLPPGGGLQSRSRG